MGLRELLGLPPKQEEIQGPRRLAITPNRCPQNHPCPAVRKCPTGALYQKGYNAPRVQAKKCTACGKCTRYCAYGALRMEKA